MALYAKLATIAAALILPMGTFVTAPQAAETKTIQMKFPPPNYDPKTVTVKAGDTVEWVNDSAVPHTATPDDGQTDPFQKSNKLGPGEKYSVVIKGNPRTVKYHCEVHGPAMAGEIKVE
jgi:plastocyanin